MRRLPTARYVVYTLLLGAACDKNSPADSQPPVATERAPVEPEPAPPETEPTPTSIAAPTHPPACEPPPYDDCPAGTKGRSVFDVMNAQPTGSIVVAGVAVTGQTACTRSEPPHCTTFLALADQIDGSTHKLSIRGEVGKPGFMCSDGTEACCTLATDGTRYAVTGTLESKELVVASVCRLVD